jgi:uncharacterized YigZ family protein
MNKTERLPGISADQYYSIASDVRTETKVKGSRFIAHLYPAQSREQAEELYHSIRSRYYDATHNCFAYRISDNTFRFSDDGEPSGTAGKPILQAIDSGNLLEVICVVTRYFGGAKLGTGGLVRAYSEAAQAAVAAAQIIIRVRYQRLCVRASFTMENPIRRLLQELQGIVVGADYANDLSVTVDLPHGQVAIFYDRITNLTSGQAEVVSID